MICMEDEDDMAMTMWKGSDDVIVLLIAHVDILYNLHRFFSTFKPGVFTPS